MSISHNRPAHKFLHLLDSKPQCTGLSQPHYAQIEKICNSGEHFQKWLANQNYFKSASKTHLGGHKRTRTIYRDSTDTKVSSAGVEIRSGWKWCAKDAVERAEVRLQNSTLVGTLATGRAGLGRNLKSGLSRATVKEKQKLIHQEMQAEQRKGGS